MMNFYLLANAAVKLAYPAFTHNDYAIRYPHSEDLSHTVTNHTTTLDRIRFGFKSALRNAVPTSRQTYITKSSLKQARNIFTNTTLNTTPSVIAQVQELAPIFTPGPALTRSQLRQQLTPFLSQLHTTHSSHAIPNTWSSNVKSVILNARRTTRSSVLAEAHKLALAFTFGPAWTGSQLKSQLAPFLSQKYLFRSLRLSKCWTLNPAPGIKGYNHRPRPGYLTFGVPFVLTHGVVGLRTVMQRISSVFQIDNYRHIMKMASRTLRIQSELSPAGRLTMTMSDFLDYARANANVLEEIDVEIVSDVAAAPTRHIDTKITLPHLKSLKLECSGDDKRLRAVLMNKLQNLDVTINSNQQINFLDFQLHWNNISYVVLHCNTTTEKLLELLGLLKPDAHIEWEGRLLHDELPLGHIPALTTETVDIRCPDNCQQLMDVLLHAEKVQNVILNGQRVNVPASPLL